MNSKNNTDRFLTLKLLRQEICERENLRKKDLQQQEWLLSQVKELKKITDCENCSVDLIKSKIDEIVMELKIEVGVSNER